MAKASPPDFAARISSYLRARSELWAGLPGNVRGAIWLLGATFGFSVMIALIKMAGERLHVTEILLFRQVFMLVFVMPVIVRGFPDVLKTKRPGLHAIRLMAAGCAMLMGFTAVIHLPLADATTIAFAKSMFTTILAILILGEVVGPRRWFAVIVGFVGVLIVLRPGSDSDAFSIYGLMALGGAACAALVMVIIRKLSQTDLPMTLLAYQGIGVGLVMVPPAIYFWQTPTWTELGLLCAMGAVSVVAQIGNILAFRAGEASAIAPFEYIRLIHVVILGFFLFGDWPDWQMFLGAAVIVGASVYTMHREAQIGRQRTSAGANEGGNIAP